MITMLLSIIFTLRGLSYLWPGMSKGGLDGQELYAGLAFVALGAIAIFRLLGGQWRVSDVVSTTWATVFIAWCCVIYLVYIDVSSTRELAKFTLPFVAYIVLDGAIPSRVQYGRLLLLCLLGYSLPTLASGAAILSGQALYEVNYFTGLGRYRGVFDNPHDLGHTMTLIAMVAITYAILCWRHERTALRRWFVAATIGVGPVVLFNLYQSYVRTAMLGLFVFLFVLAVGLGRRAVLVVAVSSIIALLMLWGQVQTVFYDVTEVVTSERPVERIGSSRPIIWAHNLAVYGQLSVDKQLAGVGVGNQNGVFSAGGDPAVVWNSHNDFLDVLMQTGVVGLFLFLGFQLALFRRLYALEGGARAVFMGLYMAVFVMNVVSNSYVSRTGLGQVFYMVVVGSGLWRASRAAP